MKRFLSRLLCRLLCAALCLLLQLFCGGCAALPADAPAGVELPVLMYHSVLKDPAKNGEYVVSPAEFEADLAYLVQNGYTAVTIRELVHFVEGTGALPPQPVLITFDDGYLNFVTYALPLLQKYDMKAVLSVIGEYTRVFSETPDPNPNYAHCTFEDLRMLSETGCVEIQNHSYNLHTLSPRRGSSRMKGESESAYYELFTGDALRLQRELTEKSGVTPVCYTYPFGIVSKEAQSYVKQLGFAASLSCRERMNCILPGEPGCLFDLGRYNRPGGEATLHFMQRALNGK